MKKFLCLILTLAILTGLAAPALAADAGADARLTAVTNKVKATLGLDTDGYDSFYGNLNEQLLVPVWSLNWSGTGGSLSIQADEDGRILSYYYYDAAESNDYPTRYAPTFPKGKEETARAAATAFLKKVLDSSTESVVLKADSTLNLGATSFSYWGTLLINGLPSPFQYGISVRASDNTVRSFYRDSLGTKLLGGVPSASTGVDAGAAGDLLKATLDLRLEYVASDDGKKAVLRWLPTGRDEYYVDARTGELVNLTELYAQFSGGSGYGNLSGGATADSTTSEAGTKGLTEAELSGIAKLEGVQSKEALDALLRKIAPLGLSNYSLSTANFWLGQSDDSVSCSLQYTRELKGQIWRRYITVDAKTGTLQSVYSSIPWFEKESDRPSATVDSAKAEALARAFLKTYYPNDYAKLALYTAEDEMSIYGGSNSDSFTFRFCQQENGYFYANNYYTVSID
ncbi:YcdB/YcdC domain-containing protein, partial [Desulfovibrio sp.]|uniref:YcdB/YcdC domain-containing protein n=1 Tax=Desulfovibrio sp. TaxID=885 RepID=UPI002614F250